MRAMLTGGRAAADTLKGVVPRVLAGLLGGFAMLNLLGDLVCPGFDATIWWIDLRILPGRVASPLLAAGSLAMLAFAVRPHRPGRWRRAASWPVAVLTALAAANAAQCFLLAAHGAIRTRAPVPLSLPTAAALGWVFCAMRRPAGRLRSRRLSRRSGRLVAVAAAGMLVLAAPLAQMYCFGKTDYRRPAEAIVVFGAGVHPDGRLSDALADRMRTAVDLYRQGYAATLIVSGGPGMGAVHETEAMRDFAIADGVPAEAIVIDAGGVSTRATVANTSAVLDDLGAGRVLAVSHFYHLPRIKLAYQRAGREVYTVPARETCTLRAMPYYLAREIAAMWVYYVRPLAA